MFLHVGGDTVVRMKDVISIIDHQTVKNSNISLAFMEDSGKEKRLIDQENVEIKSYVITSHVIYCSPISSLTLKKRAQFLHQSDVLLPVQTDSKELTE
ncbi:extracellular matrix regulator RemB [Brevibacillus daliensis]|uniref:extracellular matrix regulator RemB n=1 Tax=Brevibacillus daliensis TaxID=2892995 RepID=UPI001E63E7E7|nr:extracellular matrix/biofilm biosynthesis regulator RemA family protein [Brevibacillus daliensis]